MGLLDKVLRAGEGRVIKELEKIANQVNKFESEVSALDDLALRNKTDNKAFIICRLKDKGT